MRVHERDRARKRDTGRKALLGAGRLALLRSGDTEAEQVCRRIRAGLDERSARTFDGWRPAGGRHDRARRWDVAVRGRP